METKKLHFLIVWLLLAAGITSAISACGVASPLDTQTGGALGQATILPRSDAGEPSRPPVVTATPDDNLLRDAPVIYDYTELRESGPRHLDPILAWDTESQILIRNVMETLVYPHPQQGDAYIPLLASDWQIDDQGRTYTFTIRRGVRFSNGSDLTASDVAYSLQRLLLASPSGGPQSLLIEPLLGISPTAPLTVTAPITPTLDAAEPLLPEAIPTVELAISQPLLPVDIVSGIAGGRFIGDRVALTANVPAASLLALCNRVQASIVANDGDNSLTIHLQQPWAPLLSLLSQTWTAVLDRQWAIEQGAWDGQCETWQQWYALDAAESHLGARILGSGPYLLDAWTPGVSYVLRANTGYWRAATPMWQDGPSGPPALQTVRMLEMADPNQRWQRLEDGDAHGDAHTTTLTRAGTLLADRQTARICTWPGNTCRDTNTPDAPLRRIDLIPQNQRLGLFFNFNIPTTANAYVGSGQLDGEGIPPDFFADRHVRRAFAYCFDQRAFSEMGLGAAGYRPATLLPTYISDVDPPPTPFPHLLRLCNDEFALAWDGQLAQTGFYLQMPYQAGNVAQQTAALMLQQKLQAVNPAYRLEPVAEPASRMPDVVASRLAPLSLFTWTPPAPDAYYWVAPAFSGEIGAFQQMAPPLSITAAGLVARLHQGTPTGRSSVYIALQHFYQQEAPFLILPDPTFTIYQQRDVATWLHNAADPLPYFYAFR